MNHPDNPEAGTRPVTFGREIYIERDDFMENPPKKFYRLSPGKEVRLRYAYFVTCREVVKDAAGEVVELRCTYDPATNGGNAPDGRKVQATLHWVAAADAVPAEVRLYTHLFTRPDPGADGDVAGRPQPGLAGGADRLPGGAGAGGRCRWARRCSSSGRVFRARPGFAARAAGVQPHGRAARHLGEGERQGMRVPGRSLFIRQRTLPEQCALP